jgi:phosphoribosylformimino-5-aminoimidazole carboxamide ribotide isomerase
MKFEIYPAIDIRENRVVRLSQGDYNREISYSDKPLELAAKYKKEGASWIHLVDLNAAKTGSYKLTDIVANIKKETGLNIQSGGGIRNKSDMISLIETGIDRIIVGTLAIKNPDIVLDFIKKYSVEKIVIALDTLQDSDGQWKLPAMGWTEPSTHNLFEMLNFYQHRGLRHILCTDISRDGMLSGLNNTLYRKIVEQFPYIAIQASGGVNTLQDIRDAKIIGTSGVILGRALLEKRFSLKEALIC